MAFWNASGCSHQLATEAGPPSAGLKLHHHSQPPT